jgi:formylglycine-generating enzyme required for sulfatase activity
MVNWTQCDEVCRRLDLTLPSEAQWEYGARAGTGTPWWPGDDPTLLVEVANLADRSFRSGGGARDRVVEDWDDGATWLCHGGRYAPNLFGLHDVHGNVWEWCLDSLSGYMVTGGEILVDPVRLEAGGSLVCRGGGADDVSVHARSSDREGGWTGFFDGDLGLRPARRISP